MDYILRNSEDKLQSTDMIFRVLSKILDFICMHSCLECALHRHDHDCAFRYDHSAMDACNWAFL